MNNPKLAQPSQNNFFIVAEILSLTPGRIRIGIALSPHRIELINLIAVSLKNQLAVEKVKENLYSGTITIFYPPQSVNSVQILDKLTELGLKFSDKPANSLGVVPEYSKAAVEVTQVTTYLNRCVRQASNNIVDLGVIIPLSFALLAWRQLILKGWQLETIPWYVLAWYAFDSFIKLQKIDKGSGDFI